MILNKLFFGPAVLKWKKENIPQWEKSLIASLETSRAKRTTSIAHCLNADLPTSAKKGRRPTKWTARSWGVPSKTVGPFSWHPLPKKAYQRQAKAFPQVKAYLNSAPSEAEAVVVTDNIQQEEKMKAWPETLVMAEAIRRTLNGESAQHLLVRFKTGQPPPPSLCSFPFSAVGPLVWDCSTTNPTKKLENELGGFWLNPCDCSTCTESLPHSRKNQVCIYPFPLFLSIELTLNSQSLAFALTEGPLM